MSDYKEFIRKYLLEGGYGVYARIIELYSDQVQELGTPSAFRRWLSIELDVPLEKINLSSLNSAFQQKRKKKVKDMNAAKSMYLNKVGNNSTREKNDATFRFTKPKPSEGSARDLDER